MTPPQPQSQSRSQRPRSSPDAGFTVIEALVVALMMSVVASVAVAVDVHLRRPKTQVVFIAAPAQPASGETPPSTSVSAQPAATGDGQQLAPLQHTRSSIDAAARDQVSMLGKEVATYFVDGTAPLRPADLTAKGGHYELLGYDVGPQLSLPTRPTVTLLPGGKTAQEQAVRWCVQMVYVGGTLSVVNYSGASGLMPGPCLALR